VVKQGKKERGGAEVGECGSSLQARCWQAFSTTHIGSTGGESFSMAFDLDPDA